MSASQGLEQLNRVTPDTDSPILLYRSGEHAIYWLGLAEETAFRCNVYLIRDGDRGILVDPGGHHFFAHIHARVEQIMPPEQVTGMILCHQDPDVAGSMVDWLTAYPGMTVYSTPRTHVLLPHYGLGDYQAHDVEASPVIALGGQRELHFHLAPFLHFPGAFVTYDTASGYLFSGDIWAALDLDWRLLVDDFDAHIPKMDLFHKDYMAGNTATRGFVLSLAGLDIRAILPQHGSLIRARHVPQALDYLQNLECGLDLLYADLPGDAETAAAQAPPAQAARPEREAAAIAAPAAVSGAPADQPDASRRETTLLHEALAQAERLALLREKALRDLHVAEERLQRNHRLIESIEQLQTMFIGQRDPFVMYGNLLDELLALTDSAYGFVGEVLADPDGTPYLKTYALTNLAWDAASRQLYEEHRDKGFEFRHLDNLFGHVILSGEPVISNAPRSDPRRGGLPRGHPPIDAFLGIPVYHGDRLVGEIGLANREAGYDQGLLDYMTPLLVSLGQIIVARQDQLARRDAEQALQQMAHLDGLTQIPNRRRFDEYLDQEWRRGQRLGTPLSAIMIDIDHFKRYNDHYGHQAGDDCLCRIAAAIQQGLRRPSDLAARYGGEEFVCLLPDTALHGAVAVAREIRRRIAAAAIPHARSPVADQVTVSMGVSCLRPNDDRDPAQLIAQADEHLYRAKSAGRDRITSAGGDVTAQPQ